MRILKNEDIKNYVNYKIGGKTDCLIIVEDEKEIVDAVGLGKKSGRFFILGGGTNVLFTDKDFKGTIIKIGLKDIKKQEDGLFVSSGVLMVDLLNFCLEKGLSGLEWAGGLPGTVGGAIRGNAGAFGGEIKDLVLSVKSLAFEGGGPITKNRNIKECLFGYRDSIFKHSDEIILGATLKLKNRDKKKIEKEIEGHILYRKEHQPLEYPSAGSTFKNIPVSSVSKKVYEEFKSVIKKDPFPIIPVAAVLDKLGFKGKQIGGAQISEKHPNFFINKNNASFGDVIGLINLAKEKALEKYGVVLKEEIEIVNF
ncbi:MAG: UDP-N-acetylmuramate dehydrogenase [Patescibacteria group bacterium]